MPTRQFMTSLQTFLACVVALALSPGCSKQPSQSSNSDNTNANNQWREPIAEPLLFDRPGDVGTFVSAMMTAVPPRNEDFVAAIRMESQWASRVAEFELERADVWSDLNNACLDQFGRTPRWLHVAIWPIEDWTTKSQSDSRIVIVCSDGKWTRTLVIKNDSGKWFISSESLWEGDPIDDPVRMRQTLVVFEQAHDRVKDITAGVKNGAYTFEQIEKREFNLGR